MRCRLLSSAALLGLTVLTVAPAYAQVPSNSRFGNGQFMPLAPIPPKGEPVAPFMEGWFRNPDGTFTLSFGYFNLNTEEVLDIPLGPDNFIEPAEFDGVQPTHFPSDPRRDRGVFQLTVPASYADGRQRVTWTITANGATHAIAARVGYEALQLGYEPKAMGSVPPTVSFSFDGEKGQGLAGIWAAPRRATVGEPMMVTLWGEEISERFPEDVVNTHVSLTAGWNKYQGPAGAVMFAPREVKIGDGRGRATTNVTFTEPGEYVIRARVDNFDANDSQPGDQCCWTNAYLPVIVGPVGG